MSTDDTTAPPTDPKRDEVEAFVDEHREDIEFLAGSDLPVAGYYQNLLDYADEGGEDA